MSFVDPLVSFARGQAVVNDFANQLDQRRAARGVASGNYAEALSALGNMGNIDGVIQVQKAQAQNEETQRAREEAGLAKQVAFSRQATRALSQAIQSGQDPLTTFDGMVPAFQALGATPDQVQTYRQALATNPTAFVQQIEQLTNTAARQLEIVNLGGGTAVAVDKITGDEVNRFVGRKEPIELEGVLYDPDTFELIIDGRSPEYKEVRNTDGTTSWVAIDQPAPIRGSGRGGGTFESVIGPLLQREGGFVAQDGRSGAPANFGINQRANPDVDVRNLTPDRAAQIYRERYWNPVVQAGVPEYAREAVFDFAVNAGPQRALEAWRRSGGDIAAFNEQRLAHYRRQPDYARNGRSWERRVAETTPATVDTRGGERVVAQGENRGLTPAQQRAEERSQRVQDRQYRQDARQLRKDFEGQADVKNYEEVRSAYTRLQDLARSGTATDDTAIGFEFMKMLDPTSVVRESEYALVGQSQGITGQALVALQRLSTGQRLTPELRRNLVNTAGLVFRGRQARYNELVQQYRGYAQEDGIDPDRIVPIRGTGYGQGNTPPRTNAPGIPFNLSPPQLAARQELIRSGRANPSSPVGSPTNPRYINLEKVETSRANIRPGQWFYTENGEFLQMPNPNPFRRRR